MPALFTRMSTRPHSRTELLHGPRHRLAVGDVHGEAEGLGALAADRDGRALEAGPVAVEEGDAGAGAREGDGGGGADAAGGARDERDAPMEGKRVRGGAGHRTDANAPDAGGATRVP